MPRGWVYTAAAALFLWLPRAATAQSTWAIESVGVNPDYTHSLALDTHDVPHISYIAFTSPTTYRLVYTTKIAAAWVAEIVDTVGPGGMTSIALDGDDNPHIAYHSMDGLVKYARKLGGVWDVETIAVDVEYGSSGISLALDSQGNPHIAYWAYRNLTYASRGGSWGFEIVASTSPTNIVSLALDTQNVPHIIYWMTSGGEIKYARKPAGAWLIETVTTGVPVGLAVDPAGQPHIAYTQTAGVAYATKTDGSWIFEILDPTGSGGLFHTLALDSQGNPHISYKRSSPQEVIRHATRRDGTWTTETVETTSTWIGAVGVAVDSHDVPHLCYDVGGAILKYATRSFCSAQNSIVSFQRGLGTSLTDAWQSLGPRDGRGTPLGYGGQLTLRFLHDIVDQLGPDLRVWELGHNTPGAIDENYRVEASLDGNTWSVLDSVPGDVGHFDLSQGGLASARYIRISDLPPLEQTPPFDPTVVGADIDAVEALHCASFETDCSDGYDNDGDGLIDCQDPDCRVDADHDGHYVPPCGDDCNDYRANVHPGLVENCRNGVDDDCNGLVDCADPDCHDASKADTDQDGTADCDDACPYLGDRCQLLVWQAGAQPNSATNLDILVCAHENMPPSYTSAELEQDIDAIRQAFFTLPVSGLNTKVTFWRCAIRVDPSNAQSGFQKVWDEAHLRHIEAIAIRAPVGTTIGTTTLANDITLPNDIPLTFLTDDPRSSPPSSTIPALHELGHSALGLQDEYWGDLGQCKSLPCRLRSSPIRNGEPPANVWGTLEECQQAGFETPCWELCREFWRFWCTAYRLGDHTQNGNLMRAKCPNEIWNTLTYGEAGDARLRTVTGLSKPSKPGLHDATLAFGDSLARTLSVALRFLGNAAIVDSVRIKPASITQTTSVGNPVYLELRDSGGNIVQYRSIWDPRYATLHDSLPTQDPVPVTITVGHASGAQRWRVVDRDTVVLTQGSLGRAFLQYCGSINYTDAECFREDTDGDSIPDVYDNCPTTYNPDQRDLNGNGIGRACDPTDVAELSTTPFRLFLSQSWPNPLRAFSQIAFTLPSEDKVRLRIFTIAGKEVVRLVDRRLGSGPHAVTWDGRDSRGRRVASGIYFYRLETSDRSSSKKLVVLN